MKCCFLMTRLVCLVPGFDHGGRGWMEGGGLGCTHNIMIEDARIGGEKGTEK